VFSSPKIYDFRGGSAKGGQEAEGMVCGLNVNQITIQKTNIERKHCLVGINPNPGITLPPPTSPILPDWAQEAKMGEENWPIIIIKLIKKEGKQKYVSKKDQPKDFYQFLSPPT
jgi:hypothetical protein